MTDLARTVSLEPGLWTKVIDLSHDQVAVCTGWKMSAFTFGELHAVDVEYRLSPASGGVTTGDVSSPRLLEAKLPEGGDRGDYIIAVHSVGPAR